MTILSLSSQLRGFGPQAAEAPPASCGGAAGRQRTACLAMMAATGLYLLFEVPFGSLVLDVVGSAATRDEVDRLEWTGRIFTALAVLIVVWGWLFDRYVSGLADLRRTVLVLAATAVVVVPVAHQAVWYAVEGVVAASSPGARQRAANAQLLRTELFSAKPRIDGLVLETDSLTRPEWKAFATAAPLVGISAPHALTSIAPGFHELMRRDVDERLGGPARFREREFEPALVELRKAYEAYRDGLAARTAALGPAEKQADARWNEWRDFMLKVSEQTMRFTLSEVRNLRAKLALRGLKFGDNWDPRSEADFKHVVLGEAVAPAEAAFDAKVREALGTEGTLPRDIDTFARFASQGPVQAKMKSLLGLDSSAPPLPIDAQGAAFEKDVYRPVSESVQRKLSAAYVGDPSSFADGQANGTLGRDVFRASLVPPVALVLSLLGILVHVFKFSNYALILRAQRLPGNAGRSRRGRHMRIGFAMAAVFAALLALSPSTSRLTSSSFVAAADADAAQAMPWLPIAAVSGPIRAEAAIYPIKHLFAVLPHFAAVEAYVRADR